MTDGRIEREIAKKLCHDMRQILTNEGILYIDQLDHMTWFFLVRSLLDSHVYAVNDLQKKWYQLGQNGETDPRADITKIMVNSNSQEIRKIFTMFRMLSMDHISPDNLSDMRSMVDKAFRFMRIEGIDIGLVYDLLVDEYMKSSRKEIAVPFSLSSFLAEVMEPRNVDICYDPNCGTFGLMSAAFRYVHDHGMIDRYVHDRDIIDEMKPFQYIGRAKYDTRFYPFALASSFLNSVPARIYVNDLASRSYVYNVTLLMNLVKPDSLNVKEAYHYILEALRCLEHGGRAALIIFDGILFRKGEMEALRRDLLKYCNLHTVLRLPNGSVYGTSVAANILFITNNGPTEKVSFYDMRTDVKRVTDGEIDEYYRRDFIKGFKDPSRRSDRWSTYDIDTIAQKYDYNLDLGCDRKAPAEKKNAAPLGGAEEYVKLLDEAAKLMRETVSEIRALTEEK